MNIGFDLDKVFVDYPPFMPSRLIDKLYKKRDNGVLIYRIPAYPEQLLRRVSHAPILRPVIKKNLRLLKSIPKNENKLYLVSSRFKFLEKRTERLIKRLGLDKIFDGLFFNYENKQPHIFKNDIIRSLNLDMYIDDDLSLIKHVAKTNPKTLFFWLNYEGVNHQITNNIFYQSRLDELFKQIKIRKQQLGRKA